MKLLEKIKTKAQDVERAIMKGRKPKLDFPVRSLANVKYDKQIGYFQIKGLKKQRTLTVNTVKTFAQTMRMISLSRELINTEDIASKREAYYISKNWDEARFNEQMESDTVIDDVEAMFEVNREQLGFVPEEKGG